MDSELVEILVQSVEKEWSSSGRPYAGAQVGQILREEYLARGLPTGIGAYKPVIAQAVQSGRLKLITRGTAMFLQPATTEQNPVNTASAGKPLLGIPESGGFLRREIYDAFTGRAKPTWLDLGRPPDIQVHLKSGEGLLPVDPVSPSRIVQAWEQFAQQQCLTDPQRDVVVSKLRTGGEKSLWGRIDIPGDDSRSSLGTHFWRIRFKILADAIQTWFIQHGKNADQYILMAPEAIEARRVGAAAKGLGRARQQTENTLKERLCARLHKVIDKMSLEQLCQLRIPAEFFED